MKEIISYEGGRILQLNLKESSLIKEAKYDRLTNQLTVVFHGGSSDTHYEYYGVPEKVVLDWQEARSSGAYFSSIIKDRFTTVKQTIVFEKKKGKATGKTQYAKRRKSKRARSK